jgi:hypothetical protein
MRVLERYQLHCPDCSKGRTKIIRGGAGFMDVSPCPTCRPEDYRDFMRKRLRRAARG